MHVEIKTYSEEETMLFGEMISSVFGPGSVLALDGDLGAGKTHFTAGFAKGIGFDGYVSSPTFTIVNEYIGGRLPMYHFDTYRLSGVDDFYDSGLDEYFDYEGICVIEWSNIIEGALPPNTVKGQILGVGDERTLIFDFDEKYFDVDAVQAAVEACKNKIGK